MGSLNKRAVTTHRTHNGAPAKHITPEMELIRSVYNCLLWEDEFYENGETISKRIARLVPQVDPVVVQTIACTARDKMKLRHVPLWVALHMLQSPNHRPLAADTLAHIIQRPDELSEILAMYWRGGRKPIANQLKKGLARAFGKFDEYQLAKWDKPKEIKLRDVLRLVHPVPADKAQAALWKRLKEGTMATPETWEVLLSAGHDKRKVWEGLLKENKLGALALLRNLRNMQQAGVPLDMIRMGLANMNVSKVLPFRFIAAAQFAPGLEPEIEQAMFKALTSFEKLPGLTTLLIDVSGSMFQRMGGKSDLQRIDAACGLAILLREICEEVAIFTFSRQFVQIPPRRGFALSDAITKSQNHLATFLGAATKAVYSKGIITADRGRVSLQGVNLDPDRLIVLTDEQSDDPVPAPQGLGYMINVASNKNGVGYGDWVHCDGWSEAVVNWISSLERENLLYER